MLPNCSYIQFYNPLAYMVRRGWSQTAVFTWLLCGHYHTHDFKFGALSNMEDVLAKWYWPTKAFLNSAVQGSPLRVEAVVSRGTASEVFSLVPFYGARIVEFVWLTILS